MAKKKRQNVNTPPCNSDEPSEGAPQLPYFGCVHINKSLDLNYIEKVLQAGLATTCGHCNAVRCNPGSGTGTDDTLWLCLLCGVQGCGHTKRSHALRHYEKAHSDCHCVCINTTRFTVWCFECRKEVHPNTMQKLSDCVDMVRRSAERRTGGLGRNLAIVNPNDSPSPKGYMSPLGPIEFLARGLFNMGNTCYFNAILQCLAHTPFVIPLMEAAGRPSPILLPGGILQVGDRMLDLAPVEGTISHGGPLLPLMTSTMDELLTSTDVSFVPRMLFFCLAKKSPQFRIGEQRDAHEVLRLLHEMIREEDQGRYQRLILPAIAAQASVSSFASAQEVEQIARFYGAQAVDIYLPTEQVFRGELVSTLQCEECGHRSYRKEKFLDLSLPIFDNGEAEPEDGESKAASKRKARPTSRRQSRKAATAEKEKKVPQRETQQERELAKYMAEQEKELAEQQKELAKQNAEQEQRLARRMAEKDLRAQTYMWSINMAANIDGRMACSVAQSVASSKRIPKPVEQRRRSSSSSSSSIASMNDYSVLPVDAEEYNRLYAAQLAAKGDIKDDLERLCIQPNANAQPTGGEDSAVNDSNEEEAMYWTTMAPPLRQLPEDSLIASLAKFTSPELLTENNKVRCDVCTQRRGGPDKTPIFTNAIKQLLIYSPPPVLILHLKRFEVRDNRAMKVMTIITFPMELDITPFCSAGARKLPTMNSKQEKVLYKLYGVIEHQGSLLGGHYVSYIKARKLVSNHSSRWSFLPAVVRDRVPRGSEEDNIPFDDDCEKEEKWFYVSDAIVKEVAEDDLQKVGAYLLFYERIQ